MTLVAPLKGNHRFDKTVYREISCAELKEYKRTYVPHVKFWKDLPPPGEHYHPTVLGFRPPRHVQLASEQK
jgi:hypothetical protein